MKKIPERGKWALVIGTYSLMGLVFLLFLCNELRAAEHPSLQREIKGMVNDLYEIIPSKQSILVFDFQDIEGNSSGLGRFLTDQVVESLSHQPEVVDVHREEFPQGDFSNDEEEIALDKAATEAGKKSNASSVILGKILNFKNLIRFDLKTISVEKEFSAGQLTYDINKTKSIISILSQFQNPSSQSNEASLTNPT